jgi:hypothetical protein
MCSLHSRDTVVLAGRLCVGCLFSVQKNDEKVAWRSIGVVCVWNTRHHRSAHVHGLLGGS